jgi:hypothetical protein
VDTVAGSLTQFPTGRRNHDGSGDQRSPRQQAAKPRAGSTAGFGAGDAQTSVIRIPFSSGETIRSAPCPLPVSAGGVYIGRWFQDNPGKDEGDVMRKSKRIVGRWLAAAAWISLVPLLASCGDARSHGEGSDLADASPRALLLNIPPPEVTVNIDLEGADVAIRDGRHSTAYVPPRGNMTLTDDGKTFFLPLEGSIEDPN